LRLGTDINQYFGVESRAGVGVNDDKSPFLGINIESKMTNYFAGFAKLQTPSYHGFRAYGLAGLANIELEISAAGINDTEYDTDYAWGLGTSYELTQQWRANFEYISLHSDFDGVNAGLTYHF
jgi:opacity protein-like surface antigen